MPRNNHRSRRSSPNKRSVFPNDVVLLDDDSISDMSSLGTYNNNFHLAGGANNIESIFRPKPTELYPSVNTEREDAVIVPKKLFREPPSDDEDYFPHEAELERIHDAVASTAEGLERYSPSKSRDSLSFSNHHDEMSHQRQLMKPPPEKEKKKNGFWCTCFLVTSLACGMGGVAALVALLVQGSLEPSGEQQPDLPEIVEPLPTTGPTPRPTVMIISRHPTFRMTDPPTRKPVVPPTFPPTTARPTKQPTPIPTPQPVSGQPTQSPITLRPTSLPTALPSSTPTMAPTTLSPSQPMSLEEWIVWQSPESEDAFSDPESPQSRAFEELNGVRDLQKFGLLTLFFATNLTVGWMTPWDMTRPMCQWYGVDCDQSRVVSLNLGFNGLEGTLPHELSLLTDLEAISISGSAFAGEIRGRLTGTIPSSWGARLSNLKTLELYDNQLTGELPVSIGQLTNLRSLHLDGNQLSGSITRPLKPLSQLEVLDLSSNGFIGSIPTELGLLTSLVRLNLRNNWFFGSIPAEFGMLRHLEELYLQTNGMQGSLPMVLGTLGNLVWLGLSDNQFTGELPPNLGDLVNLEGLELSSNNFRGPLPLSLEGLVNVRVLDVADNFLTGTVDGLRSLPSLVELSLQRNSFQGSISFAFCQSVLHIASDCNSRMVCNCCTDCVVGGF